MTNDELMMACAEDLVVNCGSCYIIEYDDDGYEHKTRPCVFYDKYREHCKIGDPSTWEI